MTKDRAYKVVNGTSYDARTPDEVIRVLERCRLSGQRIVVEYGDPETGRGWGDEYDVSGTIGRSTGPVKVPLLLHDVRSTGGGAMLDHCIVAIMAARGGHDLWRHPAYMPTHDWNEAELAVEEGAVEPFVVRARDTETGEVGTVARFFSAESRGRWLRKKQTFNWRPCAAASAEAAPGP